MRIDFQEDLEATDFAKVLLKIGDSKIANVDGQIRLSAQMGSTVNTTDVMTAQLTSL